MALDASEICSNDRTTLPFSRIARKIFIGMCYVYNAIYMNFDMIRKCCSFPGVAYIF